MDYYGRCVPKHAHGTAHLDRKTSSYSEIVDAIVNLYEKIIDRDLLVRRVNLTACNIIKEDDFVSEPQQLYLFTDEEEEEKRNEKIQRERNIQEATLRIKKAYGKNAILKGVNLEEGATTIERNNQIGGHKA